MAEVFIITKAKVFEAEQYVGVAASKEIAENYLRKLYPHMRPDGNDSYRSDAKLIPEWLLFVRPDVVID